MFHLGMFGTNTFDAAGLSLHQMLRTFRNKLPDLVTNLLGNIFKYSDANLQLKQNLLDVSYDLSIIRRYITMVFLVLGYNVVGLYAAS